MRDDVLAVLSSSAMHAVEEHLRTCPQCREADGAYTDAFNRHAPDDEMGRLADAFCEVGCELAGDLHFAVAIDLGSGWEDSIVEHALWFTVEEVAERLHMGVDEVSRLVEAGELAVRDRPSEGLRIWGPSALAYRKRTGGQA
ncbi:MAG TPA: hypothetical protein VG476_02700 [Acidimicrobiales bacterium]|nr:hypothetical protein [Acidimicrobiales bacterium]